MTLRVKPFNACRPRRKPFQMDQYRSLRCSRNGRPTGLIGKTAGSLRSLSIFEKFFTPPKSSRTPEIQPANPSHPTGCDFQEPLF